MASFPYGALLRVGRAAPPELCTLQRLMLPVLYLDVRPQTVIIIGCIYLLPIAAKIAHADHPKSDHVRN